MRDLGSNIKLPKGWRFTRFDEFLKKIDRKIIIQDDVSYKCVGVRWYAMGAFVREHLLGMNIARKQQWIIRAGDVVYNKLFAWKGSFAIADDSVNGCIVSDKFPTYEVNLEIIHPDFLRYYFRTPQLAQQAQDLSKGAAAISKLTLNPPQFWDLIIPLPPLEEQRRIVAKIDELSSKIEEAHLLRHQAVPEAQALTASALEWIFPEKEDMRYEYQLVREAIVSHKQGYYRSGKLPEGEVYFARITDISDDSYLNYDSMPRVTVDDASLEAFRVKPNDFLFARTGGAGRFGFATKSLDCIFASYLIRFKFKSDYLPEFLRHYFLSPRFQNKIRARIHGGANQNVHAEDIKDAAIPIIPISEQRSIVEYLDRLAEKVEALKGLQADTSTELVALLPSILDKAFKGEL